MAGIISREIREETLLYAKKLNTTAGMVNDKIKLTKASPDSVRKGSVVVIKRTSGKLNYALITRIFIHHTYLNITTIEKSILVKLDFFDSGSDRRQIYSKIVDISELYIGK